MEERIIQLEESEYEELVKTSNTISEENHWTSGFVLYDLLQFVDE